MNRGDAEIICQSDLLDVTNLPQVSFSSLPKNFHEAIQIARSSDWLRKTMGDHVYYKLLENKEIEWENYRAQVTSYELERYLPVL